MTRATRAGVALAGFLLAVLAASGAWLWWNYRPDRDQWIRTVHEVGAFALLAVALFVCIAAVLRRARSGAAGVVAGVGVLVTVGAAFVLGRLLAWDALALQTVVRNLSGVAGALNSAVFLILVDGRTVEPSTYETWAWLHLGVSALVVVAFVMAWPRMRPSSAYERQRASE